MKEIKVFMFCILFLSSFAFSSCGDEKKAPATDTDAVTTDADTVVSDTVSTDDTVTDTAVADETTAPDDTPVDNELPDDTIVPDETGEGGGGGGGNDEEEPDEFPDDDGLNGPFFATLTYTRQYTTEPPTDILDGAVVVKTLYGQQTLIAFTDAGDFGTGSDGITVTFSAGPSNSVVMLIGEGLGTLPANLSFGDPDSAANWLVWYDAQGTRGYFTGAFTVQAYVDEEDVHILQVTSGQVDLVEY